MSSVDDFADSVGIAAAASWAAQQPIGSVRSARPALRHAIRQEAIRQSRLPQPGQPKSTYTFRSVCVESTYHCPGDNYSTVVSWSVHFGFSVEHKSTDSWTRNSHHQGTIDDAIRALAVIDKQLEQRIADIRCRMNSRLPLVSPGEYESLIDLRDSLIQVAYSHFGVNLLLPLYGTDRRES